MELRECDCGSKVIYIDPRDRYVVFCHTCDTCTLPYTKIEHAIEAWNAGQVGDLTTLSVCIQAKVLFKEVGYEYSRSLFEEIEEGFNALKTKK